MKRRNLSTPIAFLCAAFLSISLIACGEDDASFTTREILFDAKKYSSLEELPACSEELRGQVADVAGVYYACVPDSWTMLGEIVGGVCNIRACDAALEGSNVFTVTRRQVYTCRSGSWVDFRGEAFSDEDYVECFIAVMIQDTVASADSLKRCNIAREGSLSVVMGGDLMACASQKWVEVSDTVISENDLPACSKNGMFAYVLSKVQAYECKDGVWYKGGEPVSSSSKTPGSSSSKGMDSSSSKGMDSSSSKGMDSSSSKTQDSSSSLSSSSEAVSSSSKPVDDGITVRGICKASVTEAQKGDKVTYSFYNMGGTPQTFNWIFGDAADPSQSSETSPEVSFNRGGWHKAMLIVNEGMKSQSDTVVCTGLTVRGTPISGCECTTDATVIALNSPDYLKAEWTVTGCTGSEPFTYEWSEGGVGDDSVGVGSTTWTGEYAPYVSVTNSDGEYMTPSCKKVGVVREMEFDCSLGKEKIDVFYRNGANAYLPSVDLSIVSGDSFSTKITMNASDKYDYYGPDGSYMYSRYVWYSNLTQATYTLDDSLSPLRTYAVLFAGDTVCTVSAVTCGPTDESNVVIKGDEASWSLFVDGKPYTASSYEWKITDQNGVTESGLENPTYTYSNEGTVSAVLTVNKGEDTETTLACADLMVAPAVTGCTCGAPTFSGGYPNIGEGQVDHVTFVWNVTGCENEDDLNYEWELNGLLPDSSAMENVEFGFSSFKTVANKTAYYPGTYMANVTVSNDYGSKQELSCGPAVVYGVDCQASADYVNKGGNITWTLSNAGNYEPETYLWTVKDKNGEVLATGTDASMVTRLLVTGDVQASVVLNKDLDTEIAVSCPSVYVAKEPLQNCSCKGPTLLSSVNNIAEGNVVYQWQIKGCISPYSLPLTYDWSSGFTVDPTDNSIVTKTFTEAGWATPTAVVENTDGSSDRLRCEEATAYNVTCAPKKSEITLGETVEWSFMVTYLPTDTYEWTFTEGENEPEVMSMVLNPQITPAATGVVNASVTFNEGDEYEMVVNCAPLTVKEAPPGPPAITGCSCGDPDPVPRQSAEDVFMFRWSVVGCTSEGATPLEYTWSDDVTPDPDDATVAIQVPEGAGTYGPTVTVENTAGVSVEVACRQVTYSNNYSEE